MTQVENPWQPALPPSSLLQMLMLVTVLGIIFAFWVSPTLDTHGKSTVAFANEEPIVGLFSHGFLKVVNAETGETIHQCFVPMQANDGKPSRPWYCWPASWKPLNDNVRGDEDYPAIEFWSDDQALSVVRSRWKPDEPSTIVHLSSGRTKTLSTVQNKPQTVTRLRQVDDFIVAVQMPIYSGGTFNFTPGSGAAIPNNRQYEFLWAYNPKTGATDLSVEQKQRAIQFFFADSEPSFELPRSTIRLRTRTLQGTLEGMEAPWENNEPLDFWPLGNGNLLCGFEQGFYSPPGEMRARYWFLDEHNRKAERVRWPFLEGDVIENAHGVKGQPLVIADRVTTTNGPKGISRQGIIWNIASGQVIQFPGAAHEAKAFGNRLLMRNDQRVWWCDLETGRCNTIATLESNGWISKYVVVGIWMAIWLWLIRPMRQGDLTPRFGVAWMLLLTIALSAGQLDSLGFFQSWPAAEWVSSLAPFIPAAALIGSGWSKRCVSGLMLFSSLGINLLLIASLCVAGEFQDPTLVGLGSGPVSIRQSLWSQITSPGAFENAANDPSITNAGWFGTEPEYRVDLVAEKASEPAP